MSPSSAPKLPAATLRQPAPELGRRAQRTIARIIEATREVFLTHGYAGTTIDEIARVADVSRASFYTYFPSKRDVLLAAGASSSSKALEHISELPDCAGSFEGLHQWVHRYFEFMDGEGSFAFAWTQAATSDEEIREIGLARHVHMARRLGTVLAEASGSTRDDLVELGLAMFALLDRSWAFTHIYGDGIDRAAFEHTVAHTMWAAMHLPMPTP